MTKGLLLFCLVVVTATAAPDDKIAHRYQCSVAVLDMNKPTPNPVEYYFNWNGGSAHKRFVFNGFTYEARIGNNSSSPRAFFMGLSKFTGLTGGQDIASMTLSPEDTLWPINPNLNVKLEHPKMIYFHCLRK